MHCSRLLPGVALLVLLAAGPVSAATSCNGGVVFEDIDHDGMRDPGETICGASKWSRFHSAERRFPTCERSGPWRRVPKSGGAAASASCSDVLGPHCCTSAAERGRMYCE